MNEITYNIALHFLYFLFYSVGGWAVEVIYCMIVNTRRNKKLTIQNRGFLNGPLCPIYGFTAVAMVLTLNGLADKPGLLFFVGIIVCDAVEYITSFLMEKIFNARWWDYSKAFLNVNGRICFKHSVMWGILSVVFIKLIHPNIAPLFNIFNEKQIVIEAVASFFLFAYDFLTTVSASVSVKGLQNRLHTIKSELGTGDKQLRSAIPENARTLRKELQNLSYGRKRSRIMHLLRDYPEILRIMQEEIFEIISVPHEFVTELKFLQMDLESFVNGEQSELN